MIDNDSVQEAALRDALTWADPLALRAVVSLLANDDGLDATLASMPVCPGPGHLVQLPMLARTEDVEIVRAHALRLMRQYRKSAAAMPALPTGEQLARLQSLAIGEAIPPDDTEFWREEMAVDAMPRGITWPAELNAKRAGFRVLVIGAGLSGVNAGIQLREAGLPFVILEKNSGIGGTWYQNHYPGARIDYPSAIYSYTFDSDYRWAHPFPPQPEIRGYIEDMVDRHGIRDAIRFEQEVISLRWVEDTAEWEVHVRNSAGEERIERANAVISAVGLLDRPAIPEFPGIESFSGPLFHSTQWDHSVDLKDKHVAIVGSGATALQIAATVANMAGKLTVFQRSAPWMVPWPGYADPMPAQVQWLYDHVPYYRNFLRLRTSYMLGDRIIGQVWDVDPNWNCPNSVNAFNEAMRVRLTGYLEEKLAGRPDLLAKCLPDYPPLAKRFVVDAGWLDALVTGKAELICEAVESITPHGLVTAEGTEVNCDVIVLATGFRANDFLWPMDVIGRGGKSIRDAWSKDGGRAYLGMTVPDFPNLFMHYGPNSNPRAGTPPMFAEIQMRYILGVFAQMAEHGWRSVDPKSEVYERFNAAADQKLARSIWMDSRQKSYYTNRFGRVATNSPWKTIDYWRWLLQPDMNDYVTRK